MRFPSWAKRLVLASGLYPMAQAVVEFTFRRDRRRRRLADTAFFSAILAPGALCFDVGANIGEKTHALLSTRAHVVAFEPQPRCAEILLARCAGAGDLTLLQVAVGARSALAPMHVSVFHTMSSLRSDWVVGHDTGTKVVVPVVTLDQAFGLFGIPDFMKVDVEGFEWEVFQGMSELPQMLSFEFHQTETRRDEVDRCVRRLAGIGSVEFNITPGEELRFHLPDWLEADAFLLWFHSSLPASPEFGYGDIFARRRSG